MLTHLADAEKVTETQGFGTPLPCRYKHRRTTVPSSLDKTLRIDRQYGNRELLFFISFMSDFLPYSLWGPRVGMEFQKLSTNRQHRNIPTAKIQTARWRNRWAEWRIYLKKLFRDFPGGVVVKILPANAGDMGSSPGLGRSHMPQSN